LAGFESAIRALIAAAGRSIRSGSDHPEQIPGPPSTRMLIP